LQQALFALQQAPPLQQLAAALRGAALAVPIIATVAKIISRYFILSFC
jgi:hypothetical protein